MPREDYEAISRIIEEVVGRDTLTGVKLLEGIKFYFENKKETIRVINTKDSYVRFSPETVYKKDADKAMKRYTDKLNKENKKYKNYTKSAAVG